MDETTEEMAEMDRGTLASVSLTRELFIRQGSTPVLTFQMFETRKAGEK